jgi:hypothetical protein
MYRNNVVAGQTSLVDTTGSDPENAVVVEYRDIPARGRGHSVGVNAFHNHHDLIAGMEQSELGIVVTGIHGA